MKLRTIAVALLIVLAGCAATEDSFDYSKYGPDNPWGARGAALATSHQAEILQAQRSYGQSERLYKRSIKIYENALGANA